MSATRLIAQTFQKEYSGKDAGMRKWYKEKLVSWRAAGAVTRLEKPSNPPRARNVGYKAKRGFTIVRVKIRRGGRRKPRPRSKRRPAAMGVLKYKPQKSLRLMAEERAARHYPNLEVLNSYWVGEDGQHKYFEIIFVDPRLPEIANDPKLNWIATQRRRAHRGLTGAGKKMRNL